MKDPTATPNQFPKGTKQRAKAAASARAQAASPATARAAAAGTAAETALRLGALSDPVRLRLLRVLGAQELTVGEAARVLQLPQSTASRQLKQLTQSGWLAKRIQGTATHYRHDIDALDKGCAAVWEAVCAQVDGATEALEDDRRLAAVLTERPTESLDYFGRVAGDWNTIRAELYGPDFTGQTLPALLDPAWTVLDIGAGAGDVTQLLAPFVAEVIAVDISEEMLRVARTRLKRFDNVRFVCADAALMPVAPGSADAAICALALHHVDSPKGTLAAIHKALTPGGSVVVLDMLEHHRNEYSATMGHKHMGFEPGALETLLKDTGFADALVTPLPAHPKARGPGLFVARAHKR